MAVKRSESKGRTGGEGEGGKKITQKELTEFVAKLGEWGKSLPDSEQVLLQLVIGLAQDASKKLPKRVDLPNFAAGAKAALRHAARQLTFSETRSWIRGGPIWARWSSRQY